MQRPFRVSPVLQFLALRALSAAGPAVGGSDPWCGVGLVAAKAMSDGPDRRPGAWLSRWPRLAVEDFWRGVDTRLVGEFQPFEHGMGELVAAQNLGRKKPVEWGQWPGEGGSDILMGVLPPASSGQLVSMPDPIRVAGVVLPPSTVEGSAKEVFELLREGGREGWWIVPAEMEHWRALEPSHYQLAHRLGVAIWLEAPSQSMWPAYLELLADCSKHLARSAHWEQWVWPVCDLIQQGFEETLLLASPNFKSRIPWKWEGRAKNPDWVKAGSVVWEAFEQSLGGRGALEEILVANALWREKLLVR